MKGVGRRLTAFATAFAFVLTSALPQNLLYARGVSAAPGLEVGYLLREPGGFRIPANLGSLKEYFDAGPHGETPFIVHIQDAHANPDAQRSIKGILEWLREHKETGALVVGLEGALGTLHPEYLDFFPRYPRANEAAVEDLLAKGELNGVEWFAWQEYARGNTPGARVRIVGAEDPGLYVQGLAQYRELASRTEEISTLLDPYRKDLELAMSRVMNPGLRRFVRERDRRKHGFYASGIITPQLFAYLAYLVHEARQNLALDLEDRFEQVRFPHLVRYLALKGMEGAIDRPKSEAEKKRFLKELRSGKRSKEDQKLFDLFESMDTSMPVRAITEEIWHAAFLRRIAANRYRECWKAVGELILRSELDPEGLFSEMEQIEGWLVEKLAENEGEKSLLQSLENLRLTERLLGLEASPEDYKDFIRRRSAIEDGFKDQKLRDYVFKAITFYEIALSRDRALLEKTLAVRRPGDTVVLVSGGFHTPGLTALMKDQGMGYAVIQPAITRTDGGELYQRVMGDFHAKTGSYFQKGFLTKQESLYFQSLVQAAAPRLSEEYRLPHRDIGTEVAEALNRHPVLALKIAGDAKADGTGSSVMFRSVERLRQRSASLPGNATHAPAALMMEAADYNRLWVQDAAALPVSPVRTLVTYRPRVGTDVTVQTLRAEMRETGDVLSRTSPEGARISDTVRSGRLVDSRSELHPRLPDSDTVRSARLVGSRSELRVWEAMWPLAGAAVLMFGLSRLADAWDRKTLDRMIQHEDELRKKYPLTVDYLHHHVASTGIHRSLGKRKLEEMERALRAGRTPQVVLTRDGYKIRSELRGSKAGAASPWDWFEPVWDIFAGFTKEGKVRQIVKDLDRIDVLRTKLDYSGEDSRLRREWNHFVRRIVRTLGESNWRELKDYVVAVNEKTAEALELRRDGKSTRSVDSARFVKAVNIGTILKAAKIPNQHWPRLLNLLGASSEAEAYIMQSGSRHELRAGETLGEMIHRSGADLTVEDIRMLFRHTGDFDHSEDGQKSTDQPDVMVAFTNSDYRAGASHAVNTYWALGRKPRFLFFTGRGEASDAASAFHLRQEFERLLSLRDIKPSDFGTKVLTEDPSPVTIPANAQRAFQLLEHRLKSQDLAGRPLQIILTAGSSDMRLVRLAFQKWFQWAKGAVFHSRAVPIPALTEETLYSALEPDLHEVAAGIALMTELSNRGLIAQIDDSNRGVELPGSVVAKAAQLQKLLDFQSSDTVRSASRSELRNEEAALGHQIGAVDKRLRDLREEQAYWASRAYSQQPELYAFGQNPYSERERAQVQLLEVERQIRDLEARRQTLQTRLDRFRESGFRDEGLSRSEIRIEPEMRAVSGGLEFKFGVSYARMSADAVFKTLATSEIQQALESGDAMPRFEIIDVKKFIDEHSPQIQVSRWIYEVGPTEIRILDLEGTEIAVSTDDRLRTFLEYQILNVFLSILQTSLVRQSVLQQDLVSEMLSTAEWPMLSVWFGPDRIQSDLDNEMRLTIDRRTGVFRMAVPPGWPPAQGDQLLVYSQAMDGLAGFAFAHSLYALGIGGDTNTPVTALPSREEYVRDMRNLRDVPEEAEGASYPMLKSFVVDCARNPELKRAVTQIQFNGPDANLGWLRDLVNGHPETFGLDSAGLESLRKLLFQAFRDDEIADLAAADLSDTARVTINRQFFLAALRYFAENAGRERRILKLKSRLWAQFDRFNQKLVDIENPVSVRDMRDIADFIESYPYYPELVFLPVMSAFFVRQIKWAKKINETIERMDVRLDTDFMTQMMHPFPTQGLEQGFGQAVQVTLSLGQALNDMGTIMSDPDQLLQFRKYRYLLALQLWLDFMMHVDTVVSKWMMDRPPGLDDAGFVNGELAPFYRMMYAETNLMNHVSLLSQDISGGFASRFTVGTLLTSAARKFKAQFVTEGRENPYEKIDIDYAIENLLARTQLTGILPLLESVLVNLLTNAADELPFSETSKNQREGRLTLKVTREADAIRILVINPGRPDQALDPEKIFLPHIPIPRSRKKESPVPLYRAEGGSERGPRFGLRLFYSRSIAQLHGGSLEYLPGMTQDAEGNPVTVFALTVPVIEPDQARAELRAGEPAPPAAYFEAIGHLLQVVQNNRDAEWALEQLRDRIDRSEPVDADLTSRLFQHVVSAEAMNAARAETAAAIRLIHSLIAPARAELRAQDDVASILDELLGAKVAERKAKWPRMEASLGENPFSRLPALHARDERDGYIAGLKSAFGSTLEMDREQMRDWSQRMLDRTVEVINPKTLPRAKVAAIDWSGTLYDKTTGQLIRGAKELLQELNRRNVRVWIISYNTADDIRAVLKELKVLDLVTEVLGGTPETTTEFLKTGHLETILQRTGFSPAEIVTLGDVPQDILSARKVRVEGEAVMIPAVALMRSENDRREFLRHKPDAVIRSLENPAAIVRYMTAGETGHGSEFVEAYQAGQLERERLRGEAERIAEVRKYQNPEPGRIYTLEDLSRISGFFRGKAVVTGSTGALGSQMIKDLAGKEGAVALFRDRKSVAALDESVRNNPSVFLIETGDLTKVTPAQLRTLLQYAGTVYHAAAQSHANIKTQEALKDTIRMNVNFTIRLANAARDTAKRMVYVSSSHAYLVLSVLGDQAKLPETIDESTDIIALFPERTQTIVRRIREEMMRFEDLLAKGRVQLNRFDSLVEALVKELELEDLELLPPDLTFGFYGFTKLIPEQAVLSLPQGRGWVLRETNIIGSGMRVGNFPVNAMLGLMSEKPAPLVDNGHTRNFLDQADVVRSVLLAGRLPSEENQLVILANPAGASTIRELLEEIAKNFDIPSEQIQIKPAQWMLLWPDNVRLEKARGLFFSDQPAKPLAQIVRETADYAKAVKASQRAELRSQQDNLSQAPRISAWFDLSQSTRIVDWYNTLEVLNRLEPEQVVTVTLAIARGIKMELPMHRGVFAESYAESAYRYLAGMAYAMGIEYGTDFVAAGSEDEPGLIDTQRIAGLLSREDALGNIRETFVELEHRPYGIRTYGNAGNPVRVISLSDIPPEHRDQRELVSRSTPDMNFPGVFIGVDNGGGSVRFGLLVDGVYRNLPADLEKISTMTQGHETGEEYVARMADHYRKIKEWVEKELERSVDGVGIDIPGVADLPNNRMVTLGQLTNNKGWNDEDILTVGGMIPAVTEALGLPPERGVIRNDMDGILGGILAVVSRLKPEFIQRTKGNFRFDWMGNGHGHQFAIFTKPMPGPTEGGHLFVDFGRPGDKIYDTESRTRISNLVDFARGNGLPAGDLDVKSIGDAAEDENHPHHEAAMETFRMFAQYYAQNLVLGYVMTKLTGVGNGADVLFGGGIARKGTGQILKDLTMQELERLGYADKIRIELITEEEITVTLGHLDDIGPMGSAHLIQAIVEEQMSPADLTMIDRSELRGEEFELQYKIDHMTAEIGRLLSRKDELTRKAHDQRISRADRERAGYDLHSVESQIRDLRARRSTKQHELDQLGHSESGKSKKHGPRSEMRAVRVSYEKMMEVLGNSRMFRSIISDRDQGITIWITVGDGAVAKFNTQWDQRGRIFVSSERLSEAMMAASDQPYAVERIQMRYTLPAAYASDYGAEFRNAFLEAFPGFSAQGPYRPADSVADPSFQNYVFEMDFSARSELRTGEFRVGEMNDAETLRNISNINGKEIGVLETWLRRFQYLEEDRSLTEVMIAAYEKVRGQGLRHQDLAAPLMRAIETVGDRTGTYEFAFNEKSYRVRAQNVRGIIESPFGDKISGSTHYLVEDTGDSSKTIVFSRMGAHWIRLYGFYPLGLNPENIIKFFGLRADDKVSAVADSPASTVSQEPGLSASIPSTDTEAVAVAPQDGPFMIESVNPTKTIRALTHINGIPIAEIERRLRPGTSSMSGFLGEAERLIEVLAADNDFVLRNRYTHQRLSEPLLALMEAADRGQQIFTFGKFDYQISVIRYRGDREPVTRGIQESPFGDDLSTASDYRVTKLGDKKSIEFSGLVPHLIKRYGFYEGRQVSYRLDPGAIIEMFFAGNSFTVPPHAELRAETADGQSLSERAAKWAAVFRPMEFAHDEQAGWAGQAQSALAGLNDDSSAEDFRRVLQNLTGIRFMIRARFDSPSSVRAMDEGGTRVETEYVARLLDEVIPEMLGYGRNAVWSERSELRISQGGLSKFYEKPATKVAIIGVRELLEERGLWQTARLGDKSRQVGVAVTDLVYAPVDVLARELGVSELEAAAKVLREVLKSDLADEARFALAVEAAREELGEELAAVLLDRMGNEPMNFLEAVSLKDLKDERQQLLLAFTLLARPAQRLMIFIPPDEDEPVSGETVLEIREQIYGLIRKLGGVPEYAGERLTLKAVADGRNAEIVRQMKREISGRRKELTAVISAYRSFLDQFGVSGRMGRVDRGNIAYGEANFLAGELIDRRLDEMLKVIDLQNELRQMGYSEEVIARFSRMIDALQRIASAA